MEAFGSAVELAEHLKGLFATKGEVDVQEVKNLLNSYSSNPLNEKDWRQYCHYSDVHYTRNLIYANDQFELMVLYWRASQETRIHDHNASRCWMTALSGEMTESVYIPYLPPGEKPVTDPTVCPDLMITEKSIYKAGDVAFIEDEIGLHKLGNNSSVHDGITLHLYSPPIREVTLFEPEKKTISTRKPGFFSIGGKKV